MSPFTFELVSPERVLFSGAVEAVILPAIEGDMTVLAGHAPMMTALKTGFLVITDNPGNGKRILVRGGFADINQTGLTVLAERALPAEELTNEVLDHEILQAEKSKAAERVHAYLHRKEGDLSNADYWYARSGAERPHGTLEKEWASLVQSFLAE